MHKHIYYLWKKKMGSLRLNEAWLKYLINISFENPICFYFKVDASALLEVQI